MSEAIFSRTINTKSRSYFLDLKKTAGGDLYFTVTESKKRKGGDGFERGSVMVFADNAAEFFAALDEIRVQVEGRGE